MLSLDNTDLGSSLEKVQLPGLTVTGRSVQRTVARTDLTFALREWHEADGSPALRGVLEFSVDLFDRVTAEELVARFLRVLETVVADPEIRVDRVPVLDPAESRHVLEELNDTARPVPGLPFGRLFEAQVLRSPDAVALECAGETLTYAELNARANQVARYVLGLGVCPGEVVGVMLPRSPAWVAAVLGVVKAGAAFCPIDRELPEDRVAFMVADAGVSVVLDDPGLLDVVAGLPDEDVEVSVPLPGLAYVIYTSGSTGRPKGVAVTHAGLSSVFAEHIERFGAGPGDRLLQV
ncbi:AMP-binding protein, partial [Sciscionella sediminilitoris]|uniref:AMP-binding protein n=1 Tax=Sciscionella sediminilitoris TaxID=1445613 RepID=UPI0018D18CFD